MPVLPSSPGAVQFKVIELAVVADATKSTTADGKAESTGVGATVVNDVSDDHSDQAP